jgi:hypothetical protein
MSLQALYANTNIETGTRIARRALALVFAARPDRKCGAGRSLG